MGPRDLELVQGETGPVLVMTAPGSLAKYYGTYHQVQGGLITKKPTSPAPIPPPMPSPSGEWVHIPLTVPKIYQSKNVQIRYVEIHFSATESRFARVHELQLWDGETRIFFEGDSGKVEPANSDDMRFKYSEILDSKTSPCLVKNSLTVSLSVYAGSGSVFISSVAVWLVGV